MHAEIGRGKTLHVMKQVLCGWVDRRVSQLENPGAGAPIRLRHSLHEVYSHLRDTPIYPATEHLLHHVQSFSAPDLCVHGLPPFHHGRPEGGSCELMARIDVNLVVRFVTALDAIDKARRSLKVQRTGISPALCRQILDWPVLPEGERKIFAGELGQGGPLRGARAKQLISAELRRRSFSLLRAELAS